MQHINLLELRTVLNITGSFSYSTRLLYPAMDRQLIHLILHKQGGMAFRGLYCKVTLVWQTVPGVNASIYALHILGKSSVEANRLSRAGNPSQQWSL